MYRLVHHMASMDMDMSGGAEATDYSDFKFQHFSAANRIRNPDGNARQRVLFETEPLEGEGGLEQNEVAELVYLEAQFGLEYEDGDSDQNVGTFFEHRGTVGANLPASNNAGIDIDSNNPDSEGQLIETGGDGFVSGTDSFTRQVSKVEDRIFLQLRCAGGPPFDDQNTGPGGNANAPTDRNTRKFRELTGRGPVLDSSDDLNVYSAINVGDSVIGVIGNVRLHMVWDVAEVSDAGRAFSLPE